MRYKITHERIAAVFVSIGAVLPVVLTFGLVYFAPHLYDVGVRSVTPWIEAVREKVAEMHDPRALNAFNVALGGGALLGMYLGLLVGRVLGPIQRFAERQLTAHQQRAQSQNAQRP